MPSSPRVLARMDERAQIIAGELPRLVAVFTDKAIFSGPSLHFHRRAIDQRRRLDSVKDAAVSREFNELVYATLTAWGMHRMGPGMQSAGVEVAISRKLRRQLDVHLTNFK